MLEYTQDKLLKMFINDLILITQWIIFFLIEVNDD